MDILLSEQEKMFRQQLREFVEAEIAPFADEWDRRNKLAYEAFQKMAKVGLTGLTIPVEYGGQGGSPKMPHKRKSGGFGGGKRLWAYS